MKMCIFSNRIYKCNLDTYTNKSILNTKYSFNRAVRTAYNMIVREDLYNHKFEKSIHLSIKDLFDCDDYYANSIVREAKGILKSNKELWKLQIQSKRASIKNRESKIKDIEKSLKNKETVLKSVIAIHKANLSGKKLPKFKTYKGARESLHSLKDLTFQVRFGKDTKVFNIYEFEVCYLKPEIKRLKNRLKQLKYGLKRFRESLVKLEEKPKLTCFGGKSFFKNQFTKEEYIKNHNLWKMRFDDRRNSRFQISGRKDAVQGNFVFRYNNGTLNFKNIDGKDVSIVNVNFPYGQERLNYNLATTGKDRTAIAWEVEDRGDYYIIKAILELPKKEDINYSKSDGIIGVDVNVDHFALANISSDGNILGHKIIPFDILGKTSNQSTNIIGVAVKKVLAYCLELRKPLGMEDLDTEKSKPNLKYGNKKLNQKLSQFAYSKITDMIYARAYKDSVAVFKRNPAYSSQIGKLKYMKNKGLSIHTAAALVIGRRAMGFKEKTPKCYKKYLGENIILKHHWSHWRYLSKDLKPVYPKYFYQTINFKEFKTTPQIKEFLVSN